MKLPFRLCTVVLLSFLVLICLTPKNGASQPHLQGLGGGIERGSGMSLAIQSSGERTYFNGSGGFIIGSMVELGAIISLQSSEGNEERATGIGPYMRLPIVRQSGSVPFGLILTSSYVFHTYSGDINDALEELGFKLKGGEYFVSGSIEHAFALSQVASMIPEVELGYTNGHIKLSGLGASEKTIVDHFFFGLGVRFVVKGDRHVVSIMPRLRVADGDVAGGIALGMSQ